jgi:hypothetical protein
MTEFSAYEGDKFVLYAIKNNCSRRVYDLLVEAYSDSVSSIFYDLFFYINLFLQENYEKVFEVIRAGYRKLAASIIGDIKDNALYGFNNLHHQVCY